MTSATFDKAVCFASDIFSDITRAAERFFSSRFLPRNRNSGRYRKQLHAYCTRRCIIAAARELALLIFILLFSTMPLITTPCPPPILRKAGGKRGERDFIDRVLYDVGSYPAISFLLIHPTLPPPPSLYHLRYFRTSHYQDRGLKRTRIPVRFSVLRVFS